MTGLVDTIWPTVEMMNGNTIMKNPLARITLLAVSIAFVPCTAQGADDAKDIFQSLYGDQIQRVGATANRTDDLSLARKLVEDAGNAKEYPTLVVLMCEAAYELCPPSSEGRETGIDAMELVHEMTPEQSDALEKLVRLYQVSYASAPATGKQSLGERLLRRLEALVSLCEKSGNHAEALKYCKQALSLAGAVDPVAKLDLTEKMKVLTARLVTQRKIDMTAAKLKADPDDVVARNAILHLHLVDLDDPAGAMNFYSEDMDEVTKTYLPLAAKQMEELQPQACFELGQWYRELAKTATANAGTAMLQRARCYYERFLAEAQAGTTSDPSLVQARMALQAIDTELQRSLKWIPLLPMVDPTKHALTGTWLSRSGQVGAETDFVASLLVPVRPTGSYELQVKFNRAKGSEALAIGLPVGGRAAALLFSRDAGKVGGLGLVAGKAVHDEGNPASVKPSPLSNRRTHVVDVKVTISNDEASIYVKLNGSKFVEWKGSLSALSVSERWHLPGASAFGLGIHESAVAFSAVNLKAPADQVERLTTEQIASVKKQTGYTSEELARIEQNRRAEEAAKRAEDIRDRIKDAMGRWGRDGGRGGGGGGGKGGGGGGGRGR